MSIDLDVIPSSSRIPTIAELVAQMEIVLATLTADQVAVRLWADEGLTASRLLVEVIDESADKDHPIRFRDGAMKVDMGEHQYGWVSMDDHKIGFDFYFFGKEEYWPEGSSWHDYVLKDIASKVTPESGLALFPFERAATLGYSWSMRGRAGRSAATWLLAGVTATALAQLTDGFLWSDDGGADWDRVPASPGAFMAWFPTWVEGTWKGWRNSYS